MGNIIFSVLLLGFGIVYYVGSSRIPTNAFEDPVGASGYPMLIAAVVILLSAANLVQSTSRLITARRSGTAKAAPDAAAKAMALRDFGPAATLLVTIIIFLAIFETAGYLLAITLFLLAVIFQRGTSFGWIPVVTAVVGALVFHLFFGELLGVSLPVGLVGLPF